MNPKIGAISFFLVVLVASLFIIANAVDNENAKNIDVGRNACRAANPGYDCNVGWVRGEAFK